MSNKAYDNELRGVLFKNKDKEQGDRKPDYTGSATIEGIEYFMDAWLSESESGRKYMSFKFKAKRKPEEAPPPRQKPRQQAGEDDGPPW